MTQVDKILEHLKQRPITSMEAFENYGVTRLSDKIFILRNRGYEIESEPIKGTNRFGGSVTYCRYRLKDGK